MALATTTDTATLLRLAHAVIAADPVRNTVFGSIAFGAEQDDAATWAAYPAGKPLVLAARSQPYTAVTFTPGWVGTEQAEVVDALAALDPAPAAVAGPSQVVEPVAAALGTPVTERMDERLFRLDELAAPRGVAGSARLADRDDTEWLADWYTAFAVEAFGRIPPGFDARKMVQRGVVRSRAWLWLDDGERAALVRGAASRRERCVAHRAGLHAARGARPRLRLSGHSSSEQGHSR